MKIFELKGSYRAEKKNISKFVQLQLILEY